MILAKRNFGFKLNKSFLVLIVSMIFFTLSAVAQNQSQKDADVHVGFGDPNIRYDQSWSSSNDSGTLQLSDNDNLVGWKGERISMQIVLQTKIDLKHVKVVPGDLHLSNNSNKKAGENPTIQSNAIKTGFVRYVLANGIGKSGSGCGIDTAVQHLAHIVADGIDYTASTDVESYKNQPVWLTLHLPANAAPGKYKGKLDVYYESTKGNHTSAPQKHTLTYQVLVKDRTLPEPSQWKFHLDLWQYPGSVARYYKVKPWSKEHFAKMRPYMDMLASAGQKVITTSIINDPWNGQTYDPYTSMVKWVKNEDGTWRYDYRIFDKWVAYMMEIGIDHQINCYSMVPWNNKFSYFDAASGTQKSLIAKPGSTAYNEFWRGMLQDFAKHLKSKGWFDKTTIAMDERPLEAMEGVIQLIKSLPDPFKISLAGSYHQSLDKDIYDYSITTGEHYDSSVLSRRKRANLPTTYYTCCSEDLPNTFTFSPPAEAAFIPLLSAARGLSGYLRWAYNAWPEQPLTDSRFGSWSSGDTYFVYPGPGSSIRFEQLIRGIQDYEKIQLIKKELNSKKDNAALKDLETALKGCTVEALREEGSSRLVDDVESAINRF